MLSSQSSNIVYANNSSRKTTHPTIIDGGSESVTSKPLATSSIFPNGTTDASTNSSNHRSNLFIDRPSIASVPFSAQVVISPTAMSNEESSVASASSSTEIRIESADQAVAQIQGDKSEAQHVIATYGIDPVELLHMVERWTQQLLGEFKSLHHHFKRVLKVKWEKQKLTINSDRNNQYFKELNILVTKIDQSTNINELTQKINNLIETFLKLIESLEFIEQHREEENGTNLSTMKTILQRLQELNNKQIHRICIIGLEKCGKSTFINALLGFELLPTSDVRCTQICTVLKPPRQDDLSLFAIVEFYNDNEFQILIRQMIKG
ncbi:unnamed protein product, partial [Rotaria sp. Silwood2]